MGNEGRFPTADQDVGVTLVKSSFTRLLGPAVNHFMAEPLLVSFPVITTVAYQLCDKICPNNRDFPDVSTS